MPEFSWIKDTSSIFTGFYYNQGKHEKTQIFDAKRISIL